MWVCVWGSASCTCSTHVSSLLWGRDRKKGRRQRRKHWIFIRFHYKGCKGTKTKASTPEDGQGPAKCTLSRLPPPDAGVHTHSPQDIHSREYMLEGQSQPGDRGTQAGQGSDCGFAYISDATQPLGGAVSWGGYGRANGPQLPKPSWWQRPQHCPLVPNGQEVISD